MKKHLLKNALCYLVGPIDDVADHGIGYRRSIRRGAKKRNLDIVFLDPTDKFDGFSQEIGDDKADIQKLKKEHKWEKLRTFMKKIVRVDLRSIDLSDLIILYVDPDSHMCGSYHELIVSIQQKKPIFIITKGGRDKTPDWLFGIVHYEFIFDNEDQCLDYLVSLDNGTIPMSDRWVLMRDSIENIRIK
jgi:nucleoside 2-deoxyribosyltransferase